MTTLDIVNAVASKDTVMAGKLTEKAISERISNAIEAKREFMAQNLFKGSIVEGKFQTKEGNSAEIAEKTPITDAEKKANGVKEKTYPKIDDDHEMVAVDKHGKAVAPMTQPKGNA